jgi:hypothetical protein
VKNNHPKLIRAPEDSCDREVTGRLPMPGNVFRRSLLLGLREYRRYAWAQSIQKPERYRWGALSPNKSTRKQTPYPFLGTVQLIVRTGQGCLTRRWAMDIATREKRRVRGFHDGLRRAPDGQGPRSQEAKIRRKEVNPATERSSKGQPHGLGRNSRSCPCRVPKSGTPRRSPVSNPGGRKGN